MKKLRRFLGHAWQPTLMYAIGLAVVGGLLFFRLGTLVSPYSASEIVARESSKNLRQIVENPFNAPHKIGQYTLQKAGRKGPPAMRSVSALYGILAVGLFFIVARLWFTPRMATLGSLLLATSTCFLQSARSATPDILLAVGVLALIASGVGLRYTNRRSLPLLIAAAVAALALYVPGLIWFEFGFLISQLPIIARELRRTPTSAIFLALAFFTILSAPLILALIRQPALLNILAGWPETISSWSVLGRNLLNIPVQLFVLGPDNPAVWLGRLPLLDVFSSAMFVLGLYKLWFQRKLDRTKLLGGSLLAGSILIAADGQISMTLLLPFIYIIIVTGFSLMLQQWFTVFPRNPLARNVGSILLTVALLLSVTYHVSRYFIAWPNTPETRQAFSQKP